MKFVLILLAITLSVSVSGCRKLNVLPKMFTGASTDPSEPKVIPDHTGYENSCVRCHERDRKTKDHKTGRDCAECHRPATFWLDIKWYDHQPTPTACIRCHERNRPIVAGNEKHGGGNDCVSCHTAGTKWPDLKEFTHSPTPLNCATCHEIRRPKFVKLPPDYKKEDGHFDANDCSTCHTPKSDETKKFEWEHKSASGAQVKTCLPCHERLRPSPEHNPGQDCASCHLDPNKDFIDSVASPHPENNAHIVRCAGCHETANPKPGRPKTVQFPGDSKPTPGHFEKEDCLNCHNSKLTPTDKFKTTFSHDANNKPRTTCLPCHESERPDGVLGNHMDHNVPGITTKVDCILCHKDAGQSWDGHYPHAPVPTACASCHESARPATVVGSGGDLFLHSTAAKRDCSECHTRPGMTWADGKFDHKPDPKTCAVCHETKRPAQIVGDIFQHSFVGSRDCNECHTSPGKTWADGVYGHTPTPKVCATCHESWRPQGEVGSTRKFLHSQSAKLECGLCHDKPGETFKDGSFSHLPKPTSCFPCHQAERPQGVVGPVGDQFSHSVTGTRDCAECHSNAGVKWNDGMYGHSPVPTACTTCHISRKPVGPVGPVGDQFNHTFIGARDCGECHKAAGNTWADGKFGHTPMPGTCATCHETKRPAQIVGDIFQHSFVGPRDCNECHSSPGKTWGDGVYGHSPTPAVCATCHESWRPTAIVNNKFLHSIGTGECGTCHNKPGETFAGGHYNHNPKPKTCSACHEAQRPPGTVGSGGNQFLHSQTGKGDCILCHNSPNQTWADGKFSHTPAPASCVDCHSQSRPTVNVGRFSHNTGGMGECADCHKYPGLHWSGAVFAHRIKLVSCAPCHEIDRPTTTTYPDGQKLTSHYAGKDCFKCHQKTPQISAFQMKHKDGNGNGIGTCLPCHYSQGWKLHKSRPERFVGEGTCQKCHTRETSGSGFGAPL